MGQTNDLTTEIVDTLSEEDKEKLELQLNNTFAEVQSISDELSEAKKLGEDAKTKAENVKTDVFHRKQAIEELKDAVAMNAEGNITTLEVVEKISGNEKKLVLACQEFIKLGMVDIASNRAVVEFIKNVMSDGADTTLSEETVEQLKGVIDDLKQKEDLLVKQRKQGKKINEHEKRLGKVESRADGIDEEIKNAKAYDKKQDAEINKEREKGLKRDERLDAGDVRDNKQDDDIKGLKEKNKEQDERLLAGDNYDKQQDERMQKGEDKDAEQDEALAHQKETDLRHDEALEKLDSRITKIEERLDTIEKDIRIIQASRRIQIAIAVCGGLGIIDIILGIINLLI